MSNLALYIHWPFCLSKCPYCDFNSHVRDRIDEETFANAYLRELHYFKERLGQHTISSIYFGGGTPSLMAPHTVSLLLDSVHQLFDVTENTEITLEANPATFETQKFQAFAQAGINRLSIGVQSFDDASLQFLGRKHSAKEALNALEIAANLFDRYSFDLIYARPEQTLNDWRSELTRALSLARDHLSLYQLTIEKGTPFFAEYKKNAWQLPKDTLAADMYLLTDELTSAHNLPAYEVSNYATPGSESQHNITYWRYNDYLGIGPGAHSRIHLDGKRTACMMRHAPETWYEQVSQQGHGIQTQTPLTPTDLREEAWMMGMRMVEGISRDHFKHVTGAEIDQHLDQELLTQCIAEGWINDTGTHIKPTLEGRLRLSSLTERLLLF